MVDIDCEIKYHEEVADNNRKMYKINADKGVLDIEYQQSFYLHSAERYQQIADWLKELKRYKEDEEQNEPARWVTKIVRGVPTPCCSNCLVDTIYQTKFCGECGKRMENGVC